jgi:pilus assembly protein CpaF
MYFNEGHQALPDLNTLTDDVRSFIRGQAGDVDDADVLAYIEESVLGHPFWRVASLYERVKAADTVFNRVRKDLSILQPFADDPDVSEIMVNGQEGIFIERKGRLERVDTVFDSIEELEEVIRRIAARVHREINELSPILDARLEDGSRISAVYRNVALGGPILTIRRFPRSRITMKELLDWGTLTEAAADFLVKLVEAAYNIFISGGTSSGKTTFLNALSNYIPKDERVITIEDSAELQIQEIENIVRLECRNANAQNKGAVTMRQLIRASLRMRPNRIIVGEVRGEEVLDMIQAMNTGHDGSLSTGHGNSPAGMLSRLEAMFLQAADFPMDAIRRQITEGIDIMVHLGRLPDRRRVVLDISEVVGLSQGDIQLNRIFEFDQRKGLVPTGNKLVDQTKLMVKGFGA